MDRTERRPRKASGIYTAALALLADHGYDAVTVEAIAETAGVHKTTIYRTWEGKDAVIADALLHGAELSVEIPDTGTVREDLIALAHEITRLLTAAPTHRIITTVVAALPDRPATAEAARTFFANRLAHEQAIFDRARRRGEVADNADPALVMNLIGGGLWFQLVARGRDADSSYIEALVDAALAGIT